MNRKRLDYDAEHDEFIVNGNRLSRISLMNLIAVSLFAEFSHLVTSAKGVKSNRPVMIAVSPDALDTWLEDIESSGAECVLAYSEEMDQFLIAVRGAPSGEKYSDEDMEDEIESPTEGT